MASNITLSNGDSLVTIADGTADVNYTSLALVGKNFAGYGQLLNENLVIMMNTFTVIDEEIRVPDIPLNKWVNVMLRCQNTKLDVYINALGVYIKMSK